MQVYFWGKRKVSFVFVTCESEDKVLAFPFKPTFPLFFRYYFEALEEELV